MNIVNPDRKNSIAAILENPLTNPTASGTKNTASENRIIAWLMFETADATNFHCSLVSFGVKLTYTNNSISILPLSIFDLSSPTLGLPRCRIARSVKALERANQPHTAWYPTPGRRFDDRR